MSLIPDDVFNDYYTICNELLTNTHTSSACTIVYPPRRDVCPNCTVVKTAIGSSNIYKQGGPYPFSQGLCPYCSGQGYQEVAESESIRLRLYWNKKDWIRIGNKIQVPDAQLMTIGAIENMVKCQTSQYILIPSDQTGVNLYKFALAGEPFPHGFGKNTYFAAYWKRDAG